MDIGAMQPGELDAVARVWHETKQDAYPYLPLEQGRTFERDRDLFAAHIAPRNAIHVAREDGTIVGFLALAGTSLDRLYVHPAAQRRGVGGALLARARALSPAGLELRTHVANAAARRFYESHGFVAVRFGTSPPPERAADVEYHWRPDAAREETMHPKTAADCDRLFGEHVNAGDLDALVALYEPDATLVRPGGQGVAVGHAAIRAELAGLVAARARIAMNVVRQHGEGDVVVLYNDWSMTATGPDGKPVEMRGGAVEVVRRQPDGTWRFVVDDPTARS